MMNKIFKNKIVLVTGGTGSFGSTFIKKIIKTKFKEIRVFSRDENKQEKLRLELNSKKLKFFIGDIRDFNSINKAIEGADYVFHAAALKQVPSCEFFPLEAVNTNILGTENTINAAIEVKPVVTLVMPLRDEFLNSIDPVSTFTVAVGSKPIKFSINAKSPEFLAFTKRFAPETPVWSI